MSCAYDVAAGFVTKRNRPFYLENKENIVKMTIQSVLSDYCQRFVINCSIWIRNLI